ncbi:MAG: glutamine synthetase III [Fibrobacteraceae bacterium]|nr:glutamine synthetase III [Fibrobacteraceae bacterium]
MMNVKDMFGSLVFNAKTMTKYLSDKTTHSLLSTMEGSAPLDASIADEVAEGMKTWAMEHGVTHFTHWFQPLTGVTAEKHDAFINPDFDGGVIFSFSGKELLQAEPDASSFPSGGLRATFEARGYTAWDPTSPAFIKKTDDGLAVLCIPTVFCGYHGQALDKKTPLLRSQKALISQLYRVGKLFGLPETKRPYATLGPEQEYFLVDAELYAKRPDLIQTGRTLFGVRPARHQQLDDHYFGQIKPRILSFMAEVDNELWKLGIPAKTRHNEVAPAQFEIAPIFEEQNLAVDHNMLTMDVLQMVAARHNLVCLLHEKPFAGVNGSGKHNNWSITGPDGKNWLSPGKNPQENAKFLLILVAIIKAVDEHARLIRAAVAAPGNDHRLGANEAPPAIISIFLGDQLSDVVQQLKTGAAKSSKSSTSMEIGVDSLPKLSRDATDRNRTSPFAFTGNKFELRAVGSTASCATANTVLNLICAASLDEMLTQLENDLASGKEFHIALQELLTQEVNAHDKIIFDGNGYSEEWVKEAKRRGLPNIQTTPEALKAYLDENVVALFEKYNVLSREELKSRYVIGNQHYETIITLEAECSLRIAKTMILPAAISYATELADSADAVESDTLSKYAKEVADLVDDLLAGIQLLEKSLRKNIAKENVKAMEKVREAADALELIVPENQWPLPGYGEMFFVG